MTIKKAYVELVDLLEANQSKKVSSILPQILEMVESKKVDSTYLADKDGKVIAIFCYYHKQWEIVNDVPFGSKANSKTGLNTMCKVGTSAWTKAQRDAKKANTDILKGVAELKIEPSDILTLQAEIKLARTTMKVENMPKGFASEQDVLKHLAK